MASAQAVPFITLPFKTRPGNSPLATIELGTPGQSIPVTLDTGSWASFYPANVIGYPVNTWTGSSYVPESAIFNSAASSTFEETKFVPDGYWNAPGPNDYKNFSNDYTTWGGVRFNYTFVAQTTKQDPVVGLDIRGAGSKKYGAIMLKMQEAGKIDHLVISMAYDNSNSFSPNSPDYWGNITFGAIDYSKFVGKLYEVPLNEGRVTIDNVTYSELNPSQAEYKNDEALSLPKGTTTMFDTGGINMVLPLATYNDIVKRISSNGKIDMNYIKEHQPVISYNVGENYSFKVKLTEHDGLTGIIGIDSTVAAQGPALFKQSFSVWDFDNKRMLFAKPNPNPGAPDIRAIDESYVVASKGPKEGI